MNQTISPTTGANNNCDYLADDVTLFGWRCLRDYIQIAQLF